MGPGGLMRAIAVFFWLLASTTASFSSSCPDNPNALGTSRVLTIGPEEFARIGRMQYEQTLPLGDHEVVLTFDDGPIPPYSNVVLETLASQCIKATYFLVGEMARAHPAIARRATERTPCERSLAWAGLARRPSAVLRVPWSACRRAGDSKSSSARRCAADFRIASPERRTRDLRSAAGGRLEERGRMDLRGGYEPTAVSRNPCGAEAHGNGSAIPGSDLD